MLESLMEIEVAFNLLKAGDAVKDKDPMDAHYEKLNTEIEVTLFLFYFVFIINANTFSFVDCWQVIWRI